MSKPLSRGATAFTLLELLVVIAILAVLAALAFPATRRVTESGRTTACLGHLQQIGIGLQAWIADHENTMPVLISGRSQRFAEGATIDNTLSAYLPEPAVFACPSDTRFAAVSGTSYLWNVALNGQALASLNFFGMDERQSRIPVLSDKEGFHPYTENKVNILYADGHATKDLKFMTGK